MAEGFRRIAIVLRVVAWCWTLAVLVVAGVNDVYATSPIEEILVVGAVLLAPPIVLAVLAWIIDGFVLERTLGD